MTDVPYGEDLAHDPYPAPPAWRPLSAMAVLSLVLAILLGLLALLGLWWVEVIPLLLGVFALGATGRTKKRGRGLAIAGIVISVAVGAWGFISARAIELMLEKNFDGLVDALDRGEKEKAARYAADPTQADAAASRWIERVAALHATMGGYGGSLKIGNLFLGFAAAVIPPEGVEELEPRGEKAIGIGEALWARAKFERGDAWIAFVVLDPDKKPEETLKEMNSLQHGSIAAWVRDVRVFLPRASAGK